jgi:hypothetical protein
MGRVDEELLEFYNNLERQEPIDTTAVSDESEEDSDPNFIDTDNEVDDGDDDLFVDNVDEEVLEEDNRRNKKAAGSRIRKATVAWHSGTIDDDSESEDLELPEASDGDQSGVRLKFMSFTPDDLNNPTFKIGMSFPSIEMVRKAVTKYNLRHRLDVKMPRNDKTRISAHCAVGYPWQLYASKDARAKTILVKRYVG